jgi:glycosyltransferase involved in cell wall biosynthesis
VKSLTVGITYHNEGDLLTECLADLQSQKSPPEEILIFDDASTLRPESFIPKGLNVRVLRSESNVGPAVGRNRILNEAAGDFLHFHDADDGFDSKWSLKVREQMELDSFDTIFTEVASYKEGKLFSSRVIEFPEAANFDLLAFSIRHFLLVPCGTYRTSFVRKMGGYRETLWQSEDFDFHVRLISSRPRYKILLEPLVKIRLRTESRSTNRLETRRDALNAVIFLVSDIPVSYRPLLGEKAASLGTELFQLGERDLSRKAFRFAREMGIKKYPGRPVLYQWLAKSLGPEVAEHIGSFVRRLRA